MNFLLKGLDEIETERFLSRINGNILIALSRQRTLWDDFTIDEVYKMEKLSAAATHKKFLSTKA